MPPCGVSTCSVMSWHLVTFKLVPNVLAKLISPFPASLQLSKHTRRYLPPHDCLLALEPPRGSYIAEYFTAITYDQHHHSSQVDYQAFEDIASVYSPCVVSASSRSFGQHINYGDIHAIYRKVGGYVMADITETSGLIAAGLLASPFEYSDIIISGTQGSRRGPCGALIFFRKAVSVKRVDGKNPEEMLKCGKCNWGVSLSPSSRWAA